MDSQRVRGFGLESILYALALAGLKVGARTYREWRRRTRSIARQTLVDAAVMDALIATKETPESLYGRRKMVHHLRRKGLEVAACTVDKLMKTLGMNGAIRGKRPRTTIQAKDGRRAGDLINRDFTATAPNTRWVADFTYVPTRSGFVYVAFVIDIYSRAIVAWHAQSTMTYDLVLTPVRMAVWDQNRQGHPIETGQLVHHSDAGSQGGFNWSSQRFYRGGVYGQAGGMDAGFDGKAGDEVAG